MVFDFLRQFGEKHEKLKKKIHSFRMPLSPMGRRFMSLVYFSIPLVGGYYIMEYTKGVAEENTKYLEQEKEKSTNAVGIREQNEALGKVLESIKEKKEHGSSSH